MVSDGKVMIGDANVTAADVEASNGVIHVIDRVLLPPNPALSQEGAMAKDLVETAVAAGNFTTLATALKAAGLVDVLKGADNFTVFAPTDEAFAALPAGALEALLQDPEALKAVLLYHVVPGKVMAADVVKLKSAESAAGLPLAVMVSDGKVMIGDANVTAADVEASNGVIHVIDRVLLPPNPALSQEGAMAKDLVETAVAAGNFTTLATALKAAGLVDVLKGSDEFTVFAPTDKAFKKLPPRKLKALLDNPEQLKTVLLYHVVPGRLAAVDVAKNKQLQTVAGMALPVRVRNGHVQVGGATITTPDVEAENGVIHVIDTVLIPSN